MSTSPLNEFFATLQPNDILVSIPTPISILVVDDHDKFRTNIVSMLNDEPELTVIGEAMNGADAVQKAQELAPDVVVMGIVLPLLDGIGATGEIISMRRAPKVLIISQCEDEENIRGCMDAGASGYIVKDSVAEELSQAVRVLHDGGHFFSPRIAKQIVGIYSKGLTPVQQN